MLDTPARGLATDSGRRNSLRLAKQFAVGRGKSDAVTPAIGKSPRRRVSSSRNQNRPRDKASSRADKATYHAGGRASPAAWSPRTRSSRRLLPRRSQRETFGLITPEGAGGGLRRVPDQRPGRCRGTDFASKSRSSRGVASGPVRIMTPKPNGGPPIMRGCNAFGARERIQTPLRRRHKRHGIPIRPSGRHSRATLFTARRLC